MAIDAVKDKKIKTQGEEKEVKWYTKFPEAVSNGFREVFMSPLGSFNFMLKYIDRNHIMGEGELYNYFMKSKEGTYAAGIERDKGIRKAKNAINEKAGEIFGKTFAKVISDSRENAGEIEYIDHLDKDGNPVYTKAKMNYGELLDLYMVSKMDEGKAKLERMGIDETKLSEIEEKLGDKYVAWSDWVQEEFLPENRKKRYNITSIKVYGTSIKMIPHYFPLDYDMKNIQTEGDLGEGDKGMPSIVPGSLRNRVRNNKPLSLSTNAFDVLIDHVVKMETWNAYAQVDKDLRGLLRNNYFKNLVNANDKLAFKFFKKSAEIALGLYKDNENKPEEFVRKINKLIAGGNIAFRGNTALKQGLSYPAYLDYSSDPVYLGLLVRNLSPDVYISNWKWAMNQEDLGVKERFEKGDLGNEKLSEKGFKFTDEYLSWGMVPNKIVDAFTVIAGAKSIYDFELPRNIKKGMSKEEAHRSAIFSAGFAFNETQQSSKPEFLAPIQKSRSVLSNSLSTYQNANMSYYRKMMEGNYQLIRSTFKFGKQVEGMTKQYVKEGMNEEEAREKATRDVLYSIPKAARRSLIFGNLMGYFWKVGIPIMLLGLLDDDDKKEREMKIAAATSPLDGLYLIGPAVNSYSKGYDWDVLLLSDNLQKAKRDILKVSKEDGLINWDAAKIASRLILNMGGVNMDTWENIYESIDMGIKEGTINATNVQYFLNSPKTQRKLYAEKIREGESILDYAKRVEQAYGEELKTEDKKRIMRKKLFSNKGDMTDFNKAYRLSKDWHDLNDKIKKLEKELKRNPSDKEFLESIDKIKKSDKYQYLEKLNKEFIRINEAKRFKDKNWFMNFYDSSDDIALLILEMEERNKEITKNHKAFIESMIDQSNIINDRIKTSEK
jgi:hypothetical protein